MFHVKTNTPRFGEPKKWKFMRFEMPFNFSVSLFGGQKKSLWLSFQLRLTEWRGICWQHQAQVVRRKATSITMDLQGGESWFTRKTNAGCQYVYKRPKIQLYTLCWYFFFMHNIIHFPTSSKSILKTTLQFVPTCTEMIRLRFADIPWH